MGRVRGTNKNGVVRPSVDFAKITIRCLRLFTVSVRTRTAIFECSGLSEASLVDSESL